MTYFGRVWIEEESHLAELCDRFLCALCQQMTKDGPSEEVYNVMCEHCMDLYSFGNVAVGIFDHWQYIDTYRNCMLSAKPNTDNAKRHGVGQPKAIHEFYDF
jgi:hypothetical protein